MDCICLRCNYCGTYVRVGGIYAPGKRFTVYRHSYFYLSFFFLFFYPFPPTHARMHILPHTHLYPQAFPATSLRHPAAAARIIYSTLHLVVQIDLVHALRVSRVFFYLISIIYLQIHTHNIIQCMRTRAAGVSLKIT